MISTLPNIMLRIKSICFIFTGWPDRPRAVQWVEQGKLLRSLQVTPKLRIFSSYLLMRKRSSDLICIHSSMQIDVNCTFYCQFGVHRGHSTPHLGSYRRIINSSVNQSRMLINSDPTGNWFCNAPPKIRLPWQQEGRRPANPVADGDVIITVADTNSCWEGKGVESRLTQDDKLLNRLWVRIHCVWNALKFKNNLSYRLK